MSTGQVDRKCTSEENCQVGKIFFPSFFHVAQPGVGRVQVLGSQKKKKKKTILKFGL